METNLGTYQGILGLDFLAGGRWHMWLAHVPLYLISNSHVIFIQFHLIKNMKNKAIHGDVSSKEVWMRNY